MYSDFLYIVTLVNPHGDVHLMRAFTSQFRAEKSFDSIRLSYFEELDRGWVLSLRQANSYTSSVLEVA